MDRVKELLRSAPAKSPASNMKALLQKLTPSTIIPEIDKYYVFIYKAKTKNIQYDQHPLVVVTGVFVWGFSGWNLHLGLPRRYSWSEIIGNIYAVNDEELNSVDKLPIMLLKRT